jgi:D-alanyl-D-alanine carboxypeptidase (penicillin-binding protein 5/6)
MKGFFSYILTMLLLSLLALLLLWFFNPKISQKSSTALSPLPDFLTLSKNDQVSSLTLFLPVIDLFQGTNPPPDVGARSALVYDMTTGKTLFEKNPTTRLPMASLTKVMTAIIGMENKVPADAYFVHKQDLVGEDSMGLEAGEKLSLESLLYGLILPSGNDAAEVIADNYPKGRVKFIEAMNEKIKALGLKDTHFTNPSGLEGDGDQYTTAYDLMVMSKYALENFPLFAKVAQTIEYTIPQTKTHKEYVLYNETNLLTSYPGVKGIKTGYTPEAGLCLITYLEYQDHKILAVLLNSENRRQEMKDLLDYSLKSEGITPPNHP